MPPKFFVDRNLGTRILPGLLRANSWDITTLADVFGEQPGQATKDEDWLRFAGNNGYAVLMKHKRIRYRAAETEALLARRPGPAIYMVSGSGVKRATLQ